LVQSFQEGEVSADQSKKVTVLALNKSDLNTETVSDVE
jgi:hypothetical protein